MNKSFIAGMEEAVARIAGLLLAIVFFVVFVTARDSVTLDWMDAAGALLLFWFVYELISYGLFVLFNYFEKSKEPVIAGDKIADSEVLDNDPTQES